MVTYADLINQLQAEKDSTDYSRGLANTFVQIEKHHTMLHWAIGLRDLDDITLLLKHGAEVNTVNLHGLTALHLAAMNGRKDMGGEGFKPESRGYAITMLLLEQGAEIDKRSKMGWTAADYANAPFNEKEDGPKNAAEHQDFLAVIETFKARYPEKQRHSSDETARDSDERDYLLGTEARRASSSANKPEVPFSLVGAVSSFISNAFGPAEKPARYKN